MATFTCEDFTREVLKTYADEIRPHAGSAKFKLQDDDAVLAAEALSILHYEGAFEGFFYDLALDPYLRNDQSLKNEDDLAEGVGRALARGFIDKIEAMLSSAAKIGPPELWIVHRVVIQLKIEGFPTIYTAKQDGIAVIGATWYDKHNLYRAQVEWGVAAVGPKTA